MGTRKKYRHRAEKSVKTAWELVKKSCSHFLLLLRKAWESFPFGMGKILALYSQNGANGNMGTG